MRLLLALLAIAIVRAQTCLDCICNQETGCRNIQCKWDDDAVSCGYLQKPNKQYECPLSVTRMQVNQQENPKQGQYITTIPGLSPINKPSPIMLALLLILAFVASSEANNCLDCICKQESECRNAPCKPDPKTLSCGYFQIKLDYFIDCGEVGKKPGESREVAWKRCAADKTCSYECAQKYFNRYKRNCRGLGNCEAMARLHNGGPGGCQKQSALNYFNSMKRKTGCNENSP